MTVGLHTVNLANKWLNAVRGTSFSNAATYVQLHIGDPGSAGTSNTAAGSTTRNSASFSAASSGALALSANPSAWTNGGTSETLSHISVWDASTAGNFLWSAALTSTHAWASSDTFTLTSCGLSISPLAA